MILERLKHTKFVGSIWSYIRERKILKQHQRVTAFWKPLVDQYVQGHLKKYEFKVNPEVAINKVIWQYWGQGVQNTELPAVVAACFASVEKYKGDYEIIRLSDENIKDYIDLPDFVAERRLGDGFNRTFFSDLLRLALLATYGGVWLDATILLTAPLPSAYTTANYFLFQRDDKEKNKSYWESTYAYYWNWKSSFKVRSLNSIIFAKKGSVVIGTLLDLILAYWEKEKDIIDYFFFQILYELLLDDFLKEERCPVTSDTIPHMLQTNINNPSNQLWSLEEALTSSSLHKMAYYKGDAMVRFEEFVKRYFKQ